MSLDAPIELRGKEIHVWSFSTKVPAAVVSALERSLTTDEAERAARFRFPHLRESFIVAHGALRRVLGRYLDTDPANIRFEYGPKGKPALVASSSDIRFNLSHSADAAVFALTAACDVGVDIEHIRPLADLEPIARRFFRAEEATEILALPQADRERAFFACWTRKEAYIKAIGDGLSAPLDGFRVSIRDDEPVRIVHLDVDRSAAEPWSLHDLRLAPDYAAALAYRDRPRPLSLFQIAKMDPALPKFR